MGHHLKASILGKVETLTHSLHSVTPGKRGGKKSGKGRKIWFSTYLIGIVPLGAEPGGKTEPRWGLVSVKIVNSAGFSRLREEIWDLVWKFRLVSQHEKTRNEKSRKRRRDGNKEKQPKLKVSQKFLLEKCEIPGGFHVLPFWI